MDDPVIVATGLRKQYGDTLAVAGVDLSLLASAGIAVGVARRLAQRERPATSPDAAKASADTTGTGVAHV